MFRLIRILAVVGTLAFLSPVRDESASPRLPDMGPPSLPGLSHLLTARWMGSGNVAGLLENGALGEATLKAALRRSLDPDTTSGLSRAGPKPATVAPRFP